MMTTQVSLARVRRSAGYFSKFVCLVRCFPAARREARDVGVFVDAGLAGAPGRCRMSGIVTTLVCMPLDTSSSAQRRVTHSTG